MANLRRFVRCSINKNLSLCKIYRHSAHNSYWARHDAAAAYYMPAAASYTEAGADWRTSAD